MITLVGVLLTVILLIISLFSYSQDSCSLGIKDTVILNPTRMMDSTFRICSDRWSFVSYEIEQSDYSEVHLKYLVKNEWHEVGMTRESGVVVLSGCIPPNALILIECLYLNKPPRIVKQVEKLY